jgi:hypothetical protein
MGEETYGASRVVRAYCCPQPNERYFALVKKSTVSKPGFVRGSAACKALC